MRDTISEDDLQVIGWICRDKGLGVPVREPVRVRGGYLHRMFRVETESAVYALKMLNPHIMKRETAMPLFREAERLESILENAGLPILPSLSFHGHKMQEICGQYYYLFSWFEGTALEDSEITDLHCGRIAEVLARIHQVPVKAGLASRADSDPDAPFTEWKDLARRLLESDPARQSLGARVEESLQVLYEMQERGRQAAVRKPGIRCICHNDMDSKNVLWKGKELRIIDLECLGLSDPCLECLELSLSWSGLNECRLDHKRFDAFWHAYLCAGGFDPEDWEAVYDVNTGRLDWLRYNLERAMGVGCSGQEIPIGLEEADRTLSQILYYDKLRSGLLSHIRVSLS